ncbi:MAG TPA: hypothetical protein PLF71_01630 [bacterium]|nr:MAG: Adaptor complexes medium subunit family protein [Parcubacteria group bacterium ADurb.Bin192]HPN14797.1 hypothetical protein [bacterium]
MNKKDKKTPWQKLSGVKDSFIKRDKEVEQSLRTIYASGEDDNLPDLTKLEPKKSYRWLIAALVVPLIVLILCVVAWSGFWFFKSFSGFSGKGLVITIEGPNQISLGQETTYFINYQNPLREPLLNVEIRANFPADFVPTSVTPQINDKVLIWKIGSLAAEQRGTITVKGRFTGSLGTLSAVQAVGTYRPSSYSSNFETMSTKQISYADTVLEGSIQTPEKAVPGDNTTIVYKLANKGRDVLDNIEVRILLPEGFSLNSTSSALGKIDGRNYILNFETLEAGSSTDIILSGVFASGFGGQAHVEARAGNVSRDGAFMPAQISEASFPVLAGDLSLKMVVNGTDHAERSVGYGEVLLCAIGYENMADESLKNVTISVHLDTVNLNEPGKYIKQPLVDWDKYQNTSSSTRTDQILTWTAGNVKGLEEIVTRADDSLEFALPLITTASAGSDSLALKATVFATIEGIGETKMKRTIQMAPMIFKLRTDAALSSEVRYFSEEGAPLGSGPLPPKVGESTVYRVSWNLSKNIHALKDLDVSAVLPRNVSFVGAVTSSAGELNFDKNTRLVSWKLNRMPDNISSSYMEFDIELTPVATDDGKFVDLIGDTTFQAYDENIKENIIQVIKPLNTDLQNDEGAQGKGVVRK